MIITIEEEVYENLKKRAEKEEISIPAIVRKLIVSYFNLEDSTKDYKRKEPGESVIIVNGKKYFRINCKMERQNELYIKSELKKKGMSINKLLKELIIVTV